MKTYLSVQSILTLRAGFVFFDKGYGHCLLRIRQFRIQQRKDVIALLQFFNDT